MNLSSSSIAFLKKYLLNTLNNDKNKIELQSTFIWIFDNLILKTSTKNSQVSSKYIKKNFRLESFIEIFSKDKILIIKHLQPNKNGGHAPIIPLTNSRI